METSDIDPGIQVFSKIFLRQTDYHAGGYLESFVSFSVDSFSPLPSHLPLLELSIAPCSFLVALSRALCTRANLDCFRYTIPLLPPPAGGVRVSRGVVWGGCVRRGVVVVVVAISLGPISRRGDRETTRHDENVCVCVCVCVLNRVEFELILITNREVVYIFGTDSEMEDGV